MDLTHALRLVIVSDKGHVHVSQLPEEQKRKFPAVSPTTEGVPVSGHGQQHQGPGLGTILQCPDYLSFIHLPLICSPHHLWVMILSWLSSFRSTQTKGKKEWPRGTLSSTPSLPCQLVLLRPGFCYRCAGNAEDKAWLGPPQVTPKF